MGALVGAGSAGGGAEEAPETVHRAEEERDRVEQAPSGPRPMLLAAREQAKTAAKAMRKAERQARGAEERRRAAGAALREAAKATRRANAERDYAQQRATDAGAERLTAWKEVQKAEKARAAAEAATTKALARQRASETTITELRRELADLWSSYEMSGARDKVDIRTVEPFGTVARSVRSHRKTSMNYDRLYTLWQCVQASPDGFAAAEVGSYQGGSARFIAEAFREDGRAPKVYVCDTFAGHARVDPRFDGDRYKPDGFTDTSAELAAEYLAEYDNVEIVVGDIFETSRGLAEQRFGFVHVDVDIHPATDFCLRFFAPRLAPEGLIVVDDYGVLSCPGAERAVDDFVTANPDFRMLHLLTGQAIVSRIPK